MNLFFISFVLSGINLSRKMIPVVVHFLAFYIFFLDHVMFNLVCCFSIDIRTPIYIESSISFDFYSNFICAGQKNQEGRHCREIRYVLMFSLLCIYMPLFSLLSCSCEYGIIERKDS